MSIPACFSFENSKVRTLGTPDLPLFVAIDVASALGFQKPSNAVSQHVDTEDLIKQEITDSMNRKKTVNCVNESGLYALIFGSKLPSAKRFKRWVTSEVLPAIRRNGHYELPSDTITPTEQHAIQVAVAKRARRTASNYQTIYRAIKNRYQIARYDQLPRSQFQDCIEFISCVDLSVPEVSQRDPAEDHGAVLTKEQTENLLYFLYCINYLFKDEFVMIYKLLRAVNSSHSARFFEMFQNFAGYKLERDLERQGFSVKETDCYKHWSSTYAS